MGTVVKLNSLEDWSCIPNAENPKKHKKRIIYPYLFALVTFAFFLALGMVSWLSSDWIYNLFHKQITKDEILLLCYFWGLIVVAIALFAIEGYYYLGIYELTENAVIITSPLRKKIKIAFSDIKYIGLDYGLIQGEPEFWIYISKVPIKQKYWHKITKLRFNRSTVRILYTPERFAEFISILPPHLSKELQKGVSMLRKFKVDTSIEN